MNAPKMVGRIISRGYSSAKSPEQLDMAMKMWQKLTFFLALPAVGLATANVILNHSHEEERPEYIPYEYLGIRNKRYPWGDGNHGLFHNPHRNALPGIGYEE